MGSDNCMKLSGAAVCECFNSSKILDIKKKVDNCSGTEMQKASISDGKLKKLCIKTYGACRQGGESIRPILSACQPGGATESEMKAQLGNTLKNEAATEAVEAKIDANIKAAGRKTSMVRRSVSIGGTSFALDTCSLWATAVAAWLDALAGSLYTDISQRETPSPEQPSPAHHPMSRLSTPPNQKQLLSRRVLPRKRKCFNLN